MTECPYANNLNISINNWRIINEDELQKSVIKDLFYSATCICRLPSNNWKRYYICKTYIELWEEPND